MKSKTLRRVLLTTCVVGVRLSWDCDERESAHKSNAEMWCIHTCHTRVSTSYVHKCIAICMLFKKGRVCSTNFYEVLKVHIIKLSSKLNPNQDRNVMWCNNPSTISISKSNYIYVHRQQMVTQKKKDIMKAVGVSVLMSFFRGSKYLLHTSYKGIECTNVWKSSKPEGSLRGSVCFWKLKRMIQV
jgi:hypothetical protein